MKKMLAAAACAAMLGLVGCKTTEVTDPDKVYNLANCGGQATAVVVQLCKVDTNAVLAACAVMDELSDVIPGDGETFEGIWPAKASLVIEALVAEGKLDAKYTDVINKVFGYVCKGLDYQFDKHPEWKTYTNCAAACVSGFVNGFEDAYGYIRPNVDEEMVKELCARCGVPYQGPAARSLAK